MGLVLKKVLRSKLKLKVPDTLRALRHRNYLLFINGQVISLAGSWMQGTALNWLLVNSLKSSAFQLGLMNFARQVPILALGLFAGAVADSVNRHKLIIWTQILLMVQGFILGYLTLTTGAGGAPIITFWHIMMLSLFAGIVDSFDMPARQTFLLQMVPKEDLNNAIALNSLTFNAARVVGPGIAGVLIYKLQQLRPGTTGFGEGMCFLINAVSFVAVIIQLLRMRVSADTVRPFHGSSEGYLVEGLRYVYKHHHIRALLTHVGLMSLFGVPYLMLVPLFAKDVLHGNSQTLGYLTSSIGIGAITGGVLLARRKDVLGLGRVIAVSTCGFAVVILAASRVQTTGLSCFVVGLAGFCMVSAMISSQTLVQTLISEKLRGRVMALYSMVTIGLMPFGSLLSGAEADRFGIRQAMVIIGIICLVAGIFFAIRLPRLHRAAARTPEYQHIAKQS